MFIIGEDIGRYGGEMGATAGLYDLFGEERVRDAPISETAIVGCALGVAMTGNRAIAEIPFGDFLGMCMDQVYNQAAKIRYMSGGQVRVPLVIRTTMGGYMSAAEQHSQCLESWFVHTPGIKVVVPSNPADAAGCSGPRSGMRTRCCSSSTRACTAPRARCPTTRRGRCRSVSPRWSGTART